MLRTLYPVSTFIKRLDPSQRGYTSSRDHIGFHGSKSEGNPGSSGTEIKIELSCVHFTLLQWLRLLLFEIGRRFLGR